MKRLHFVMLLVVIVFAGIFLGNLFDGRKGAHAGAAVGVAAAGVFLWSLAPLEWSRQLRRIERQGIRLDNPDEFRARFIKGARTPAVVLVLLGLIAFAVILLIPY